MGLGEKTSLLCLYFTLLDRKLSHLTSADKIFEQQFPGNPEKFSVRNRSSRVTCNLNVIMPSPSPSPNNNNNNTIPILFCFFFSELTDKQTLNDLRSALWAEGLDLYSIDDSRMGRLEAASHNDDVTKN
jgi:hypothetical protein